ncbi:MAG: hypothetical protein ACRDAO_07375 [Culicoidibacterales bacterium]
MNYTSRVQRRQQLAQQQGTDLETVEALIDLEVTKEMPLTVQIPVDSQVQSRQQLRQQKQMNQLVEEIQPFAEQEAVADTNLEILKRVRITTNEKLEQTVAKQDIEYEQAQTKFIAATQQLQALIGDLHQKRRELPKATQADTLNQRVMFDLELAQTQEMPVLAQLHSQLQQDLEDTQHIEQLLEEQQTLPQQPIEFETTETLDQQCETVVDPESISKEAFREQAETHTIGDDKLTNINQGVVATSDRRDRLINILLVSTLIVLTIAVIITLGIGVSLIMTGN